MDGNHAEIVKALRKCGCEVLSLAKLGNGAPDLLAYKPGVTQVLTLMEIKKAKGKVRPAQAKFHKAWPVHVVRSVDDALALFGVGRVSGAPEPRG